MTLQDAIARLLATYGHVEPHVLAIELMKAAAHVVLAAGGDQLAFEALANNYVWRLAQ